MSAPILSTKLFVPPPRPDLVPRQRLVGQLDQGLALHRKLTLVSAPAGFGKTTLVSSWLAQTGWAVAWLSLDEGDADLTRFLTYLVAALQTAVPTLGQHTLEMLAVPQPPSTDAILTSLLNELVAIPEKLLLVLDDYHVVVAPAVDQALAFLLDHLPPQLHLVMTTREDPQLPLPRLRVRSQLTELRAADLRFTGEETAVFLKNSLGLELTPEDVAALEQRTEGWIAGLQLAALSMRDRDDVHGFVQAFAGDNRYVVDYLVEEVLQRQPPHVRHFLLQTSILDRLCGDLCTAVTQQPDSGDLLEALERGNLFVVHLDDRRQWYRYHHLFADVLQAHVQKEQPEDVKILHQRASEWYETNDLLTDAVHHALAAVDLERVANLAERAWPAMDRNRESHVWLRWVKHLPEAMIHARPVLNACYAWAVLDRGELETAESRLQAVEKWLVQTEPAPNAYVDEAQFAALPATIAAARTYLALALGDLSGTQKHARQALRLIPEDDHHRRGTPGALLGLATLASGDLAEAYDAFSAAMDSYQKAGNTLYAITGAFIMADIRLAQGQLRQAVATYQRAVALAEAEGGAALRGIADLYTGLSELSLEQNDRQAAQNYLQQSRVLGEATPLPRWRYRYCLAQSRLHAAGGRLDEALASLDEAERHYVRGPVPDLRTPAACKARLWARLGRLDEAQRWADAQGLSVADELSYLREFDHMTLVRIRLAQGKQVGGERPLLEAQTLLSRLLTAAEAGQRTGSMMQILVLQALTYEALGETTAALAALARVLTLAAPEGYIRLFVDEGPPMAALLRQLQKSGGDEQPNIHKLLAAFGNQTTEQAATTSSQPLLDPLSERELEVLQLVAEGLSNRQIAKRLYLALSTVKGHNRVIYEKLSVNRRTEAVARARELGLL
ncbi:MAG: helix-turn-helix transcriptional regulator [Ardenticatenaceae bacterium]|nr:helix-turn-helix transcriptional regulator [Ardenticatenaceae bacterium]